MKLVLQEYLTQDNWTISGLSAIIRAARDNNITAIRVSHAQFSSPSQIRACVDAGITLASSPCALYCIFTMPDPVDTQLMHLIMPNIDNDTIIRALARMNNHIIRPYAVSLLRELTETTKKMSQHATRRMMIAAINADDQACITNVAKNGEMRIEFLWECANFCISEHRYEAFDAICLVMREQFTEAYFGYMLSEFDPLLSRHGILEAPHVTMYLNLRDIMAIARNCSGWEQIVDTTDRSRTIRHVAATARACPNREYAVDRRLKTSEKITDTNRRAMVRDFIESDRTRNIPILEQIACCKCEKITDGERAIIREEITKTRDAIDDIVFA
jgi:hypothetical protein